MPNLALVIIGWPVCTEIELSLREIVVGELTDECIKGLGEETIWSGEALAVEEERDKIYRL